MVVEHYCFGKLLTFLSFGANKNLYLYDYGMGVDVC